jgi:hypothetical protein
MLAFSAPSSKQKDPDLLCEKQASDDGFAATQIDNAYWAEFYSKSEMSQWYCTNEFMDYPHGCVSLELRFSTECKDRPTSFSGGSLAIHDCSTVAWQSSCETCDLRVR